MSEPKIRVVEERCVGCGLCLKACPFDAISLQDKIAVIDYGTCTLCGACVEACKRFEAIEMDVVEVVRREARGDVWVFCEPEGDTDTLSPVSAELLGLSRRLAADLGVGSVGVLIGNGLDGCAAEAISYGADQVLLSSHPALEHFDDQRYAAVLSRRIREHSPEVLLGGATAIGRALLPRVAVMVHTGLTADCTELSIDPDTGLLLQTRPAFGGNILATITCDELLPQMATVRPAVLPRPEADATRRGEIVRCAVDETDLRSELEWLDFVPRAEGGVDLREAEIVVTAGYGTGGPDGVALVASLAKALGGTLGASRPVVDAGWLPYPHQVGQTGTTVQPKLYVACGVSGAIQHIVGMQNSEVIVAINRDPEAPIFEHADYAIVADLHEILPELIRQIKDRAGK